MSEAVEETTRPVSTAASSELQPPKPVAKVIPMPQVGIDDESAGSSTAEDEDDSSTEDEEDESDEEETEETEETEASDKDSSQSSTSSPFSSDASNTETSSESEDEELWDDFSHERAPVSKEANEESIFTEFQRVLHLLVDDKEDSAKKLLYRLLEKPLVAAQQTWRDGELFPPEDEKLVENEEHLSRIGRVYYAIHQNLARLEPDSVNHHLQMLSLVQGSSKQWTELGKRALLKGLLDLAHIAFERASNSSPGLGSLEAAAYLAWTFCQMRFFKSSLKWCAEAFRLDSGNEIGWLVASKVVHLGGEAIREYAEKLLERDPREVDVDSDLQTQHELQFEGIFSKIDAMQSVRNQEETPPTPISITITENFTYTTFATMLCDLYDRIEAFSSFSQQLILIAEWHDLEAKEAVDETVAFLLDTIETTFFIVEQASLDKIRRVREPREIPAATRKSARKTCDSAESTDNESTTSDRDDDDEIFGGLDMSSEPVSSLRSTVGSRKDSSVDEHLRVLDEPKALASLRKAWMKSGDQVRTIADHLYFFLRHFSLLVETQQLYVKDDQLRQTLLQVYRRWLRLGGGRFEGQNDVDVLGHSKRAYDTINVQFMEFGDTEADALTVADIEHIATHELKLRCWHVISRRITIPEERKDRIEQLVDYMEEAEIACLDTVSGECLTAEKLKRQLVDIERLERVKSLQAFFANEDYEEVIRIAEQDMDWRAIEESALVNLCMVLLLSHIRLKHHDRALALFNRIVKFVLEAEAMEERDEALRNIITCGLEIKFEDVSKGQLAALARLMRQTCESDSGISSWWRPWWMLYAAVFELERKRFPSLIDMAVDAKQRKAELPSRALSVLSQAHERLGAKGKCAQDDGEFLLHFARALRAHVDLLAKLKDLNLDSFANSVMDEATQCLHCLFGRWSKRRRNVEEHGVEPPNIRIESDEKERWRVANLVLPLLIPNPLPLYDDKERIPQDLVDLITTKFEFLVKPSQERMKLVHEFQKWMEQQGPAVRFPKDDKDKRSDEEEGWIEEWPRLGVHEMEPPLQVNVYYVLAHHYYRACNYAEAVLYGKLHLTSGTNRHQAMWPILGSSCCYELFAAADEVLARDWQWQCLPMRLAVFTQPMEPMVHVDIANYLYQIAAKLGRHYRTIPQDDRVLASGKADDDLQGLLLEARKRVESALSIAPSFGPSNSMDEPNDFQWLCYFLLAKIDMKLDSSPIKVPPFHVLKMGKEQVIDELFEAACSLQLSGAQYPMRVNAKNQRHLEPVEVHYHAHVLVYKLLKRCLPTKEELIELVAYLRAFASHGVAKPQGGGLFQVLPEIHSIGLRITMAAAHEEFEETKSSVIRNTMRDLLDRVELKEEAMQLVKNGFSACVERFPHAKAQRRLAEIALGDADLSAARDFLFKGIFRRKKNQESMFESAIEVQCSDIERSGSFAAHVSRSVHLGIIVARKSGDWPHLFAFANDVIAEMAIKQETYIPLSAQRPLVLLAWKCLSSLSEEYIRRLPVADRSPSLRPTDKQMKMDLVQLHSKAKCLTGLFGVGLSKAIESHCVELFQTSFERLTNDCKLWAEEKKRGPRKRRIAVTDLVSPTKMARMVAVDAGIVEVMDAE